MVPYKINKILTDNGVQFVNKATHQPEFKTLLESKCGAPAIEQRKTKIRHPWENGQVEPMNQTLKEATVKTYYDENHAQLEQALLDFLPADNFAKRLKTIKGNTPWTFIQETFKSNPSLFKKDLAKPYSWLPVSDL